MARTDSLLDVFIQHHNTAQQAIHGITRGEIHDRLGECGWSRTDRLSWVSPDGREVHEDDAPTMARALAAYKRSGGRYL